MKKRIVSLALCFLMVLTVVASTACGKKTDDEGLLDLAQSTAAKTLTIWGIKGEGTTDEAIAAVEEEMSKIAKIKFNTAIELNLFYEDEYYDALEERFEEIEKIKDEEKKAADERKKAEREAKKKGETLPPVETVVETEETKLDEYGLPETVYPAPKADQLDIFLITSYDKLKEYNDEKLLSVLDTELSGSSKLIKQYVHPTMISAGKIGKDTVAIINQQLIGEATYMLVNKELLAKYFYHIDDIADVSARNASELGNAVPFILEVKNYEPEYQPFVGDSGALNVNYYTLNGEKSIFGWMAAPDSVYGDEVRPRFMLFENVRFTNYLKNYMTLRINNCFGSETFTPDDKFGVGIMKGTPDMVAPYEENYHVITILPPQGTEETIYNSMFAVSAYTKDLARSMAIITDLNTRSELRNLFGYGIEGVHYTVDEGAIDVISDDYNMSLEYTGNCFMAYPPEGKPADYWDIAKEHNIELVLSPFFGFKLTEDMVDAAEYKWAIGYSDWFYEELYEATTDDEVKDVIDDWAEKCDSSQRANNWMSTEPTSADLTKDPPKTLAYAYAEWVKENTIK